MSDPSPRGEKIDKPKSGRAKVWLTAGILGGLFGLAVWFAVYGWNLVPNEMDANGYVAMIGGIVFIALLGGGLMALIFWSHNKGYDR